MPSLSAIPEMISGAADAANAASGIANVAQSVSQLGNEDSPSQAGANGVASGGSLPDLGSAAGSGGSGGGATSPFSTGDLGSNSGGIQPQDALSQLQQLDNSDEQFQLQLGEEKQRHSEVKSALQAIGN